MAFLVQEDQAILYFLVAQGELRRLTAAANARHNFGFSEFNIYCNTDRQNKTSIFSISVDFLVTHCPSTMGIHGADHRPFIIHWGHCVEWD